MIKQEYKNERDMRDLEKGEKEHPKKARERLQEIEAKIKPYVPKRYSIIRKEIERWDVHNS